MYLTPEKLTGSKGSNTYWIEDLECSQHSRNRHVFRHGYCEVFQVFVAPFSQLTVSVPVNKVLLGGASCRGNQPTADAAHQVVTL